MSKNRWEMTPKRTARVLLMNLFDSNTDYWLSHFDAILVVMSLIEHVDNSEMKG